MKSDEYRSYQVIQNERTFTEARSSKWGNAISAVSALMAPISEVLRPSRKENVIGNMRQMGNAEGSKQYPTYNPADKLRTTMKETTIYTKNPTMFINNQENKLIKVKLKKMFKCKITQIKSSSRESLAVQTEYRLFVLAYSVLCKNVKSSFRCE